MHALFTKDAAEINVADLANPRLDKDLTYCTHKILSLVLVSLIQNNNFFDQKPCSHKDQNYEHNQL